MTLVLHAVALAPELLPQDAHRAQLGVLLDEAHACVDEEGDAPEDLFHQLLRGLLVAGVGESTRSRAASSTACALLIAKAISCTGVAPASCRW